MIVAHIAAQGHFAMFITHDLYKSVNGPLRYMYTHITSYYNCSPSSYLLHYDFLIIKVGLLLVIVPLGSLVVLATGISHWLKQVRVLPMTLL